MRLNLNSGWGPLIADQIRYGNTGKMFIVGKDAIAYISNYRELFSADNDGVPRAFATIAAALAQCTASSGDTILVLPGHTESIATATALLFNVAGVNIIGLGTGSLRPTLTFTAAAAKIPVSAANVTIRNVIFVANFADITTCFLLTTAPEFWVDQCEFRDTDSTHNFLALITTTVAVVADGLTFTKNRVNILGTTAATTPIKILGTHDRLYINDNFITKAALDNTSCLLAHAALVVTNLEMARNMVFSKNTDSSSGGFLITTSSTTNTGMVHDNYVKGLDVAAELMISATGSKYGEFNNLYDGDVDKSGFVSPAIGSTS